MSATLSLDKNGAERLSYNAFGFPLRYATGSLSIFAEYAAACHWHHDYELLLADEGELDYFVNGTIVHIAEGQAIFVNSNRLHYGFSAEHRDCRFSVLVFHPSLLGDPPLPTAGYTATLSADGQGDCMLLDPKDDTGFRLISLMRQIGELCAAPRPLCEFAVQGLCGELVALLYQTLRPCGDRQARDPAWQLLRQMTGYLQASYAQPIRLADIAAAGAVCRSRCCEVFRAKLGKTPMEYLAQYRLEKGVTLLQTTGMSITQIAQAVGFDGASYFSEQFRRRYDLSPRQFRALHPRRL